MSGNKNNHNNNMNTNYFKKQIITFSVSLIEILDSLVPKLRVTEICWRLSQLHINISVMIFDIFFQRSSGIFSIKQYVYHKLHCFVALLSSFYFVFSLKNNQQ